MSRLVRHGVRLSVLALGCTSLPVAPPALAQTIADYSRAQRTLLESSMAQAAARAAGPTASAPAVRASAVAALPSWPPPRAPMPRPASALQVIGVFVREGGAVAELLVDATPYLLMAGDGLPGTVWQVESVAVERVVLSRRGGGAATDPEPVRKVFLLPALR